MLIWKHTHTHIRAPMGKKTPPPYNTCTHIHTPVHTHTHTCTHIHTPAHTPVHTYTHLHTCTQLHTPAHTYTHTSYRANRWLKRGVALIPTKYGIAFGLKHLNQAGALLHIYTDGSILLTHGGVEIGQGLHTKMIQVCARCLGVPPERVHVLDTSTTTVANSSPTAASSSTDLYGMAVKVCEGVWVCGCGLH